MELDVEAEDRAAEQAVEDLLAPRADAEYLGVWPRYVPEGDDDRLGQLLADQPRQQREMIVLDEDDRALGLGLLKNDLGELAVDGLVAFPVGGPEDGPCEGDVAERPEAFVGEAGIIALVFLLGEPDAPKRIGGAGGRYGYAVIRIDHVHIGRAAAMRDPGSSTSARDGLERRNQPARRHLQLDAAAHALMHIRLAVGYDDEVCRRAVPSRGCGAASRATIAQARPPPPSDARVSRKGAGAALTVSRCLAPRIDFRRSE